MKKSLFVLMICCGSAAGFLALWLSKALATARTENKQGAILYSKYAPYLWCIVCAAVFGLIHFFDMTAQKKAEYLTVFLICLCIGAIDFCIRKIPNQLLLALLAAKVIFLTISFSEQEVYKSLLGFATAVVIFAIPSLLKLNVGAGDVKLAAVTGFYLGLTGFLQAMIVMAVTITVYGFYLIISKTGNLRTKTAMGPYLALGLIVTLLFPII